MALKFALYGDSYVKRLGAFCKYDMEVPGHVQFFGRGGMAAHRPDDGLLQQLKRYNLDVTVINIGGNDIRHNSTPADIAEDIKKLLTEIQMSGSRVYYCEITERGHFPKDDKLTKKSFNSQRKKVTKLMSRDFNLIPLNMRFPTDYDEDRIHLNDQALCKTSQILVQQANSEAKLLQQYKIHIPKGKMQNLNVDRTSTDILKYFHPPMLKHYNPSEIMGDGNCLYRAMSVAIAGLEKYHGLLRLFTSLELIQNRNFYDTRKIHNNFLNDSRILISDYDKILHDAICINSYSELAHFYALSAALTIPFHSYYPPQVYSDYTSDVFTRRIVGRNVKDCGSEPSITIMWTSTVHTMNPFQPNHFVPLIEKTADDSLPTVTIESGNVDVSCQEMSPTELHVCLDDSSRYETVKKSKSENGVSIPDESSVEPNISLNDSYEIEKCSSTIEDPFHDEKLDAKPEHCRVTGSGSLQSGFLNVSETVHLLLQNQTALDCIPQGKKENVYFILNNDMNLEKRKRNKRSCFSDDCGVWDASKGATPKFYYHLGIDGALTNIFLRDGMYCLPRQVNKKRVFIPMDPQPASDKVVVLHRYYTSSKLSNNYKKRVTWLGEGGLRSSYAIAEYLGTFPGLSSHGNSTKSSEYLRTPDYVLDEARELSKKMKPHQVYQTLQRKYDETSRPTSISQIRDTKKYDDRKELEALERLYRSTGLIFL